MEWAEEKVHLGEVELTADVLLPDDAKSVVLFAHGSGSSRRSPRNRRVAGALNRGGIGTILIDLLTEPEEVFDLEAADLRFDIFLLGQRLTAITDWIGRQADSEKPGSGVLRREYRRGRGAGFRRETPEGSAGGGFAGRTAGLGRLALRGVLAPTLFIVGGDDTTVLDLNDSAMAQLPRQTEQKIEIVPGAGHLFEEPGALDRVAALAKDWFRAHLDGARPASYSAHAPR